MSQNPAPFTDGYRQGFFTPRYPKKYLGNTNKIIYRSSWELYAYKFLDGNKNVLQWGTEPIAIHYCKPVSVMEDPRGWRPARYFPDLYVVYRNRQGTVVKELIEIKPLKQTQPSKSKKESVRLRENYVLQVNEAKWAAAKAYCTKYGINFCFCTEKDLYRLFGGTFGKKPKL